MVCFEIKKILTATFLCLLPVLVTSFKPSGKYDISMGELTPLCSMVKEFGETGKPPEPKPFDPNAGKGDDCIYFKWVPCERVGDPSKPCGWYEMTKCGSSRRKRSGQSENDIYSFSNRTRRESPNDLYDGPVYLGFPDELEFDKDVLMN